MNFHHVFVFILTFISFAMFHASRKAFSNVKYTMSQEWSPTNTNRSINFFYKTKQWNSHSFFKSEKDSMLFMGLLDLGYMLSYSLGLFICGILGDRFDARKVLTVGTFLSAISAAAFGCTKMIFGIEAKWIYTLLWCLAGFFQASGWPCAVAIVGCWFGRSSRGFILSVWGCCASFGNVVGAYIVGAVLIYGYQYAFLVTSSVLFASGVLVFFGILVSPNEIGMEEPNEKIEENNTVTSQENLVQSNNDNSDDSTKAMPFYKVLLLPGVIPYTLSYMCLKPINYAFFFWLPFYLSSKYNWSNSESDYLSTWYDYGGMAGGIFFGIISDKVKFRGPVMAFMLILSPVTMFLYQASPNDKIINGLLMASIGIFLNGAALILSTSITADLGRQEAIKENEKALGTVTGIIDGSASFSAAIWQILVPLINEKYGWNVVFYFLMVLSVLSVIIIFPLLKADFQKWKASRIKK